VLQAAAMTSSGRPGLPLSPFAPAPNGWRIAIGDPDSKDITVVPLVGWQPVPEGAECAIENSVLEPVVLFDNAKEPIISTALKEHQDHVINRWS
jgi:hypothetical protein